jgi:L-lactate utilization protein LutB
MNSDAYFGFIQDSKSVIAKKSTDNKLNIVSKSELFSRLFSAGDRDYIVSVLQKSLENLHDNLMDFECKFSSKNGAKIYWAVDYDDVLTGLHTIISKRKVKTINYHSDYLYEEVGLEDFFKKEKLKYSDIADMQFIKADRLICDMGSILIFDKDISVAERLNNGSINVFIVGIEQLISSMADAELYSMLMFSTAKKDYNSTIFYRPLVRDNDFLFIVDNGRSTMLSMQKQRIALTCLHCGKCKKVCPVYNIVGDKPYNNVFTGPIANVILPFFETVESYKHVSYACLMCGNCEKVCPVSIPIKDLIIENRIYFRENKYVDSVDNKRYSAYKKTIVSRSKMNKSKLLRCAALKKFLGKSFCKKRKMPLLESVPFNKQYIKKNQNNVR